MPSRKTARASQRQLSVETVGMSSDPVLESDGDGDFDPIQAATELRRVIDEHKKRRMAIRKKIEKKYESKVAEIVERTEMRLAERNKTLARTRQEQLAQLVAAVEARDVQQRAIADKVGRFYDSCVNLTSLLQNAYMGLAEEAHLAVLEQGDGETASH